MTEPNPLSMPVAFDKTAGPEQHAIVCQGLSKSYGEVQALVDLNLAVPYGSIFGFLGRNGAGKTTTMRMLAGLAWPTAGRAWVAGLETTSANRLARARFGYLPQDSGLLHLDVCPRVPGLRRPDPRSTSCRAKAPGRRTFSALRLKEAAKRHIGGFSGGMVQRLGIAQALIANPPVLLLDEPTCSLDPAGRHEVLGMIEGLRGKVTVFLSSHILSDIERVCDTLAVLHKGRLVLVSGRDELLEAYAVNAVELELDKANGENDGLPEFIEVLSSLRPGWQVSGRMGCSCG